MLHNTDFNVTELWFAFSNGTILACNALEQTLFCIFLSCIFFVVTLDKIISPSNYVLLYTSVGCISFFFFQIPSLCIGLSLPVHKQNNCKINVSQYTRKLKSVKRSWRIQVQLCQQPSFRFTLDGEQQSVLTAQTQETRNLTVWLTEWPQNLVIAFFLTSFMSSQ
jgi:hypothetical protein